MACNNCNCKNNIGKNKHRNNFAAESMAPMKLGEKNAEKKGYETKVYSDTQISSSSTTKKHRTFVSEPMGDKSVSHLAGVGPATAKELEKMGYDKAYKYLKFKEYFESYFYIL